MLEIITYIGIGIIVNIIGCKSIQHRMPEDDFAEIMIDDIPGLLLASFAFTLAVAAWPVFLAFYFSAHIIIWLKGESNEEKES